MDSYIAPFYYYKENIISRLISQKHYCPVSFNLLITLMISTNDVRSSEDIRLINAMKNLQHITGQKPALIYCKSRYVGTSKRNLFLVKLNISKTNSYFFLEELSICLLPYLQKRFGAISSKTLRDSSFTLFCKDFQFFYYYPYNLISEGFKISLTSSSSRAVLLDYLQFYKFNFVK
jgi:ribosomal protein L5